MSHSLVFRRAAEAEFDAAALWYEQQQPGLGHEFVDEVDTILARIIDHPEGYPTVEHDVREAPVPRFPYAVYYRVRRTTVVVLAVFHGARNPAIWQQRR